MLIVLVVLAIGLLAGFALGKRARWWCPCCGRHLLCSSCTASFGPRWGPRWKGLVNPASRGRLNERPHGHE